jgi:hypothetical protein
MTGGAIRAQLAFVSVLMTRETLGLETKKRIRFVTLIALKRSVLSLEDMPGEAVIE